MATRDNLHYLQTRGAVSCLLPASLTDSARRKEADPQKTETTHEAADLGLLDHIVRPSSRHATGVRALHQT